MFSVKFKAYSQQAPFSEHPSERLIKIGNHKLFTSIKGNEHSKITVVFESGAGGGAQDWTRVISKLSPELRTIAYDRAGSGKSEKGPLPQTMTQNVFELHKLLKATRTSGPIILVGQSMGGLIVRLYTRQYGKKVKGLVLVDPTHESSVLGSMKYGGWTRIREKAIGKPIPAPQIKTA